MSFKKIIQAEASSPKSSNVLSRFLQRCICASFGFTCKACILLFLSNFHLEMDVSNYSEIFIDVFIVSPTWSSHGNRIIRPNPINNITGDRRCFYDYYLLVLVKSECVILRARESIACVINTNSLCQYIPTQFRMIHNVLECVNKGDDQIPIIPDDVSKVETIQRMYWLRFLSLHIAWYVRNFSVSISVRSCRFNETIFIPSDERYCKLHHIKPFMARELN